MSLGCSDAQEGAETAVRHHSGVERRLVEVLAGALLEPADHEPCFKSGDRGCGAGELALEDPECGEQLLALALLDRYNLERAILE